MLEQILLNSIAGYDEEKQEAKKIIEVLKNHDKYEKLGAYIPKGLILSGKPGVGKTMLAKAIANESGVPLFEFETNESETAEATIKSLKDLFVKAKSNAPSVIFIDELDELVNTEDFVSDYTRKMVKILLTELDGLSNSQGVLVIATTNYRSKLPSALIRSGRMDKRINVEMPDVYSREAIFKCYLDKQELTKNINAKELAEQTINFSGADIKTLINEVIIDCTAKEKNEITLEDFERTIPEMMFKDIKRKNHKGPSELVCAHEIGHFIANYIQNGSIGSITTERYGAVKGHTRFRFDDEMMARIEVTTRNTYKNRLVTLLAGMAGEEVIMNDISTGSYSDINEAKGIIDSIIQTGILGFDVIPPAINNRVAMEIGISEDKGKHIEIITANLLKEAFDKAKEIIQNNIELSKLIFETLKKKESLSEKEAKALIREFETERGNNHDTI